MHKSAFIDDRTLDAEANEDIIKAVEEIVKMDEGMGQETNISKSKFTSTSKGTRRLMTKTKVAELDIKVVKDFKLLLGGRCTIASIVSHVDPEEAADETKLRVKRIKQMPLKRVDKASQVHTGITDERSCG